jgi:L(+)-tartrate dehydratase beta subunit
VPPSEIGFVNFHCSPAATLNPDGSATVGADTATASFRFAKWLDGWFKISHCNIIIGKAGMTGETYKRHFVPNNAIYLTTVGYGTGALLERGIKRVVAQLGRGAGLGPGLVGSGRGGFRALPGRERSCRCKPVRPRERQDCPNIAKLYAGAKPATMRRYGETDDKTEDVIGSGSGDAE